MITLTLITAGMLAPGSPPPFWVVLLVSFALVGWSARSGRRADGPDDGGASGTHPALGMAVAGPCLLAAGLIVCYGLYLIIA